MVNLKNELDLEVAFHARQFAYDILRRAFIEEPARDYLEYFIKEEFIDLFPFSEDSAEIQEGVQDVKEFLSRHDLINNNDHYEDLHWDFTKMFIGPFDLCAPPWESVYVRKDRLLFQANTVEVRHMYQNFGYEINQHHLEAEDHIGLELDFIFHLNKLCIDNIKNPNFRSQSNITYLIGEQSRFLRNHLLAFVNPFSDKVIENAQTQYYSGMAKLLRAFLNIDYSLLNEMLKGEQIGKGNIKEERSNA